MDGSYIEIYNFLNGIKELNADIYSKLLSIYGENLVNKVIEQMIDENSQNISKFDYYISKIISYDDATTKSIYELYGIDLSLLPCLSKEENIVYATELYYLIKELEELMLEYIEYDEIFKHSWISDNVDRFLVKCNDKVKVEQLKRLYDKYLVKRNMIVEGNLRLVITVAKRFHINEDIFTEAIQYGNMGLIRAIEKYNPSFNASFSTYAYYWIRQSITKSIYDLMNPVSVPAYQISIYYRMKKVQKDLFDKLEREPTNVELAEALRVDVEDIEVLKRAFNDSVSLYNPVSGEKDDESMLIEFIVDENASIDKELFETELDIFVGDKIGSFLTDKERMVIERRFGFYDGTCQTLEEIGKTLGVTRERIRQIESKVIRKLKYKFKDLRD